MAKLDISTAAGHPAYNLGLTSRGYANYRRGGPLALAEKSPGGIARQAKSQIQAAYGPAESALSDRQSRVEAIQLKRQRDNEAYQAWLAQQQSNMRTEADARNSALQSTIQQHQINTRDAMLQVTQQAQTRMAAGNVSGTLDAGGVVSGAQRASIEQGAARAASVTQSQTNTGNVLAATQANNQLAAKALEAKDFAKSLDEIAQVADSRTKLQLQKGSDMAKQMAHLFDVEVTKAQQANQLDIASQKLGVQKQAINQRNVANIRTTNATRHGQQLTYQAAQQRSMDSLSKLTETQRHNRATEKAANDKLAQSDPAGGGAKGRATQVKAIREVNKLKAYMQEQLGPGRGPGAAPGGAAIKKKFDAVVQNLLKSYPNSGDLIPIAYELWRFGGLRDRPRQQWLESVGPLPPSWKALKGR